MTRKILALILASAIPMVCPAIGTVYTVSPTGSDYNSGTAVQPFKTIAHSVTKLRAGDALEVLSGTYNEGIPKSIPAGTSWNFPVVIRGKGPTRPILMPPSGAERVAIFSGGKGFIILDGLILDARRVSYECVKITDGAHHIRIQNCELTGSPNHGVLVTGEKSVGNEFLKNDVHHNGSDDFDHGFYITTSRNLIEGCQIHHNAGWGVHIYGGKPYNNENIVRSNRLFSNGEKGRGPGVGVYSGTNQLVYNNVIWGNAGGIYLDYGVTAAKILNNTITGNRGFGIRVGDEAFMILVQNNISHSNVNAGVYVSGASRNTAVRNNLISFNGLINLQNISATSASLNNLNGDTPANDPHFTNSAASDFRLMEGSPARSLGVPYPGLTNDINGILRANPTNCSAGAHEYQALVNQPTSLLVGKLSVSGSMQLLWDNVNNLRYASSQVIDSGVASFAFNVSSAGTYYVWCLALATKATADSFWVSVNGGEEDVFDIAEQKWSLSWQWSLLNGRAGELPLTLNPRVINLSAGSHILNFRGREPRAGISQVLLTTDSKFNPATMGSQAFAESTIEYRLQSSATLADGDWSTIGPIQTNSTGGFDIDLAVETGIPMRFYRVIRLN